MQLLNAQIKDLVLREKTIPVTVLNQQGKCGTEHINEDSVENGKSFFSPEQTEAQVGTLEQLSFQTAQTLLDVFVRETLENEYLKYNPGAVLRAIDPAENEQAEINFMKCLDRNQNLILDDIAKFITDPFIADNSKFIKKTDEAIRLMQENKEHRYAELQKNTAAVSRLKQISRTNL